MPSRRAEGASSLSHLLSGPAALVAAGPDSFETVLDAGQLGEIQLPFQIDAARTKAYAEATNDDIKEHVAGELAPPLFSVVPAFGAKAAGPKDIVPAQYQLKVVHGEQDIFFHRPMLPGTVVVARAMPVGVHVKATGTVVVTKTETREGDGTLLNTQYFSGFYRGATDGQSVGEEAPPHHLPDDVRSQAPVAKITQKVDDDQTYRYAGPSGDGMIVHLDPVVARSVGLPGIIVHGLCTMGMASHALIKSVAGGDPRRLKRLAVRFSFPVIPGQTLTTAMWELGKTDSGQLIFGFETDANGRTVIRDGLAEVEI